MDYANERYIRLYTRDTKTWCLLGWEGQAVFPLIARKLDRAGLLEDVFTADDVAVVLRNGMPIDIIEVGLRRLIDRQVFELTTSGLLAPNFIDAQETPQSNAQRNREYRARRRDLARNPSASRKRDETSRHDVTERLAGETKRNETVTKRTPSYPDPDPSQTRPEGGVGETRSASQAQPSPASSKKPKESAKPIPMPADFRPPREQVEALATKHEVRPDRILREVPELVWYWTEGPGSGQRRSRRGWLRTFANRVDQQAKSGVLYAEPQQRQLSERSNIPYHQPIDGGRPIRRGDGSGPAPVGGAVAGVLGGIRGSHG